MKQYHKKIDDLRLLIEEAKEGIIDKEKFIELDTLLRNDPDARQFYLEYSYVHSGLSRIFGYASDGFAIRSKQESPGYTGYIDDFLMELAEEEKHAPAIAVPKQTRDIDPVQKIDIVKPVRNFNKRTQLSILVSAAAILLLFLFVRFAPDRSGKELATLKDSIKAKWIDNGVPMISGVRLMNTDPPFVLGEGMAELHFDGGARVIVEAPSEFQILTGEQIQLNYGKIFVDKAGAASEFIVQTRQSKIIDIGTQFGVYTDTRGETELHVFEGKTILIAGLSDDNKKVMDVVAGQAYKFNDSGGAVQRIGLSENVFVKLIDSQAGLVWRGQKNINLADVIGGGDGFGDGVINTGISLQNGVFGKPEVRSRRQTNKYTPVASSILVDGVFVPNGSSAQIVSSSGLVFKECPPTSGYFFSDIVNGDTKNLQYGSLTDPNNIKYKQKDHSLICIHANAGITFNLNGFRSSLPGTQIRQFHSRAGINKSTSPKPVESRAELWILVDGQVRYHKIMVPGMSEDVKIELGETDCFLTLVTTDGQSLNPEYDENGIGHDLCLFGDPMLILE